MKKSDILMIIVVVAIACLTPLVWEAMKAIKNQKLVTEEARKQLWRRTPPPEPVQDLYGNDLRYEYEATEHSLISTVTSYGPDGVPSDDDFTDRKVDLNKSKIIGYWAGTKLKEVKEGWLEGLKAKSPFKKKETP